MRSGAMDFPTCALQWQLPRAVFFLILSSVDFFVSPGVALSLPSSLQPACYNQTVPLPEREGADALQAADRLRMRPQEAEA